MPELPRTADLNCRFCEINMNTLSNSPFFLPPHQENASGVDYLGMRAINLQLMDDLLPGLNNVARHIRPFALLCWTIWIYEAQKRRDGAKLSSFEFTRFREKIECLYVHSHRVADYPIGGIAGVGQSTDLPDRVQLKFKEFGREPNNTLMNAVTYGPGLKGDSGYQFAYAIGGAPGCFAVTPAGANLAIAFDERLQEALTDDRYNFLCSTSEMAIDKEDAAEFAEAWDIAEPTAAEKRAFFVRFHPDGKVGEYGSREKARSVMLDYILGALREAGKPIPLDQLRHVMTLGAISQTPADQLPAKLQWRVLQLRQAQRLATEALFGWLERCIWDGARITSQFIELMKAALRDSRPTWSIDTAVADLMSNFASLAQDSDGLFNYASAHPDCALVEMTRALEDECGSLSRNDEVVARAIELLALVGVHTEHFLRNVALSPYVISGALRRMPLHWLATTMRSLAALNFERFAETVIETWLISQHLGVAASRVAGEGGKIRLSIDDAGITSLLPAATKCWSPGLSADRLAVALSLLAECGKIDMFEGKDDEMLYGFRDTRR